MFSFLHRKKQPVVIEPEPQPEPEPRRIPTIAEQTEETMGRLKVLTGERAYFTLEQTEAFLNANEVPWDQALENLDDEIDAQGEAETDAENRAAELRQKAETQDTYAARARGIKNILLTVRDGCQVPNG